MSKMNCDQPLDVDNADASNTDVIETKNVILNCQGYKLEIPYDIAMKFPTVKAAIGKFDTSGGYYLNHSKEEVQQFVARYEKSLEDDLGLEMQLLTEKDIEIADYAKISDDKNSYDNGQLMWLMSDYKYTFVVVQDYCPYNDIVNIVISARKEKEYSSDVYIRTLQVLTHSKWNLLSYKECYWIKKTDVERFAYIKMNIVKKLNKIVRKQID